MAKIKGCFNDKCIVFKRQDKYEESKEFCPECGNELNYVCQDSKCYKPLHNKRQKRCDSCLKSQSERNEKVKKQIADILKSTPVVIGTIAVAAIKVMDAKIKADKVIGKKKK